MFLNVTHHFTVYVGDFRAVIRGIVMIPSARPYRGAVPAGEDGGLFVEHAMREPYFGNGQHTLKRGRWVLKDGLIEPTRPYFGLKFR